MKKIFINLFNILKLDAILRSRNRNPRVLFWHGLEKNLNPYFETESFNANVFEKQIKYLNKYYEIISIEELEKRLNSNSFTNREVVLTFDDGYANNLYVLEPILDKYNLPYTVFISVEHIETGQLFPTSINRMIVKGAGLKKVHIPSQKLLFSLKNVKEVDLTEKHIAELLKTLPLMEVKNIITDLINNISEKKWHELLLEYSFTKPMNWDEVKTLASKPNVTIGSHCMYHICCHSNQSLRDIKQQIVQSKKIIEEKINKECSYFAYPNGDYTDYSNSVVEKNYRLGFSTEAEKRISNKTNKSAIPRIIAPLNINLFKFLINYYPKK